MPAGSVTLRELLIRIGVEADEEDLAGFDDALANVKKTALDLISTLAAVAAGAAAVAGAFVAQAVATADSAKAIENQAASLGLTTDAYQELLYAAGKYGTEAGDLADVFGQISQLAIEAANGNKTYAKSFDQLGISVDDLKGKNPDELFMMLAEGLAGTEDATKRLALASSILGEDSAKKLGPLLAKGAAGVAELRVEAHRLGVVMSKESIKTASAFSNQVAVLGAVVTSLRNEVGLALIPTLSDMAAEFLTWIANNRDLINAKIDEYMTRVSKAFVDAYNAVVKLIDAVGGPEGLVDLFEKLAKATAVGTVLLITGRVLALVSAVWTLVSAVAAAVGGFATLGIILAGVGSMLLNLAIPLLVLEDLYTYATGGTSAVGTLLEAWSKAPGVFGAAARAVKAVLDLIIATGVFLRESGALAYQEFIAGIEEAFASVRDNVLIPIASLLAQIGIDLDFITKGLDGVTKKINETTGLLQVGTGVLGGLQAQQAFAGSSATIDRGLAASFAPTRAPAGTGGGASTTTQSVAGNTYNISGVGMSTDEVRALIASEDERKARTAEAVFAGGAV